MTHDTDMAFLSVRLSVCPLPVYCVETVLHIDRQTFSTTYSPAIIPVLTQPTLQNSNGK